MHVYVVTVILHPGFHGPYQKHFDYLVGRFRTDNSKLILKVCFPPKYMNFMLNIVAHNFEALCKMFHWVALKCHQVPASVVFVLQKKI